MKLLIIYIFSLLTTPTVALAQGDFKSVIGGITDFLMSLVPLLTGVALLVFFWGLVEYISQAGSGAEVEESKKRMVWGIVGLFVITTIWGIVKFIGGSLGIA